MHYITNLPYIEQLTDYSNLGSITVQTKEAIKEAAYIIVYNNHQRRINYKVVLLYLN